MSRRKLFTEFDKLIYERDYIKLNISALYFPYKLYVINVKPDTWVAAVSKDEANVLKVGYAHNNLEDCVICGMIEFVNKYMDEIDEDLFFKLLKKEFTDGWKTKRD